ncbi:MAG: hypothetical protein JNM01_12645 [Delftia acidovorans]|nr:hypothetical protein [Delftia acidovorans]
MKFSEEARAFLATLDPRTLSVSDGGDGRPVWVAVDAEAQRVYRVYANGVAEGFGDGRLMIYAAGPDGPHEIEILTIGQDQMICQGKGAAQRITYSRLSEPVIRN